MPTRISPAVDVDLRLVRYFTVVAEHGNFSRAADELHLAQPSLSRYVQRLERQVGARLLDRTAQGSRLTEAGEAFLPQALSLLNTADMAVLEARASAAQHAVTIGYTGDLIVTPAVRELRKRFPQAGVPTLHLDWHDAHDALVDHRVDAVITRLPIATEGFRVTNLYQESRVLLVPVNHRLSGREFVTLDDFADEPLVRYSDPLWNAFWRIDPRPDGSAAPDGPLVPAHEDKLEAVAAGEALTLAPASSAGGSLRRDLRAIPIRGIEPIHVVLATRENDRGRLIEAFHDLAIEYIVPRKTTPLQPRNGTGKTTRVIVSK